MGALAKRIGIVSRSVTIHIVFIALIIFYVSTPAFAADQTIFGPETLGIKGLPIHLSFHNFSTDEPGEGILVVTKRTPDKEIHTGFIMLNHEIIHLRNFLGGSDTVFEKMIYLKNRNSMVVFMQGVRDASIIIEVRKKSTAPTPTVTFSAEPSSIKLGESSVLRWNTTDADNVSIDHDIGGVSVNGSHTVSPVETTTYTITASGPGGDVSASVTIEVIPAPFVSMSSNPEIIQAGGSSTLSWSSHNVDRVFIDNGIGTVSAEGSITVSPEHTTTYTITATGSIGSALATATVTVTGSPAPPPEGSFGEQYADLIPPDATVEQYDTKRLSMITGLVRSIGDVPIVGVSVTVLGRPEYGTATTDADGRFSIPVEGGTTMTVTYQKPGLLTSQRKVYVPWNDIAIAETIRMIAEDPVATTITFDGSPDTVVTHRSTEVTDEFGTRSATMVFTGDNHVYLVDENGNDVHELTTITTRATEYTTPESMPAILPPTSAYTYCAELSVDGVKRIRFDKPVITWIDNFLGFDVGMIVPVGYYDRDRGVWVPSDNGIVVKLLDTDTDGIVDALDANDDDQPDDLDNDGSFSNEVTGLDNPEKYVPGATFWRVAVAHFTSFDCNWPFGPPPGAIASNAEGMPDVDQQKDEDCSHPGCIVEARSRIVHEDIPIPGTDMTLHYSGNRVTGYKTVITVPASGETVPVSLKGIIIKVEVVGRTFEQTLDPLPYQTAIFVWDGLDYVGRRVNGASTVHISTGFVYDGVYWSAGGVSGAAFAQAGTEPTLVSARQEMILWEKSDFVLEHPWFPSFITEGWALSGHHYGNSILYKGDGTFIRNSARIIDTVAGNGITGYSGDGGPATEAALYNPSGVAVDASGNFYIADNSNRRIRKVDTNGIITTVVGTGAWGYSGDGGPAIEARLKFLSGIAVDAPGNFYIADGGNHNIRKVEPPSAFAGAMTAGDIAFTEEGGFGYIMSSAGRHRKTIDLDTGIVLREFGYNEDNNLISITDQFNNQIAINRDANGMPVSITSPDGIVTALTIDGDNHLTRVTYADGSCYGFEYTADGLLTAKVEPEGNRFEHMFDNNGRLADATDEEGGHWNYEMTSLSNGDILTKVTTGEGNVTSYLDHTYSTGEYTSTITDATGSETLFTRSADGLTVDKSLSCGMTLGFRYGIDSGYSFEYVKEMNEMTPSSLEKLTERNKTYEDTDSDDIPDLITETVTINGKTTIFEHDILPSTKTITSPGGRVVTVFYNPANLLTSKVTIPGLYDTDYGYNVDGRLTSITRNNRATIFTYTPQGFLASVTDPELKTISYYYDAIGRVTQINRPDTSTIGFTYDRNGNMTVLTTPSDVDHQFGYNGINRNSSYNTPISGSYSYVYNKDRQLQQTNFPSGLQINNIYASGLLIQTQTPEGNIDYTYLCGSKLGSITNGTEQITFGYDGKLLTTEQSTGTLNQTLSYGYNNDFNPVSFTYGGYTESYAYDNDGLLTGAGRFTIGRNVQNGLPESVTGGSLTLGRSFNGYGEVTGQTYTINSQSTATWELIRNDIGRITEKTETTDGTTAHDVYTYDPLGRLRTVTRDGTLIEEYRYDLNGTRNYAMNALRTITGRTFTYSDEDHLLTAGTVTYQYGPDGFLQTKTDGTDETHYDYSSRGELLGVTLPDGMAIDYIHDPLGRRIAKKVNGTITEKYLWQGLTRLLAVYDGSGSLTMRFEYADSRVPYAMTKDGTTYYLTCDQVGSVRIVADSAGTVVKQIDYDTFGNIITDTNPAFDIPFGFAGGLHDQDTKLVRFGVRDYDPDIGRWTAKDPIFFNGGDNDLYGYCLSDPVNGVDPFGLEYWSRVWKNFQTTNVNVPGLLAPTGTGIVTAGRTAQVLGTTTLRTWISSGLSGATLSGASFTGLETGVLVGGTGLMNFAFTGIAWEAGAGIGSLVSAVPVYGADQSITDWWANFWWDLLNDEKPDPCK